MYILIMIIILLLVLLLIHIYIYIYIYIHIYTHIYTCILFTDGAAPQAKAAAAVFLRGPMRLIILSPFLFTDWDNPVLQAPRIMCRSRLSNKHQHITYITLYVYIYIYIHM